jgi:hypothetical protein
MRRFPETPLDLQADRTDCTAYDVSIGLTTVITWPKHVFVPRFLVINVTIFQMCIDAAL